MAQDNLARAHALLDAAPLIDGHNDLPYLIRVDPSAQGDARAYGLDSLHAGDTDLPRLRAGKVAAQFWAAFVPPKETQPASFALQQIALIHRMNSAYDDFLPAFASSDVLRAKQMNKIASFIAIENGAAIENRLDALDAFYALGVRLMTLCHAATTDWCDSATDAPRHNGLSDFGKSVIDRMNALGMIVDLAHVADSVMSQALDRSAAPVVFSHSNARALCNHPRNIPDDILAEIPKNGGVVMATFVPDFITLKSKDHIRREQRGCLTRYCDHLDYLRAKIGADHIGIGSDFFGGPQGAGLKDVACFPHIFAELFSRDWSDSELRKLAGENFLRVFSVVEHVSEQRA